MLLFLGIGVFMFLSAIFDHRHYGALFLTGSDYNFSANWLETFNHGDND